MKRGMKVIFWDIDDVLNELMRRWFEDFWLKEHPECNLNFSDLVENPPCNILKISLKEYQDSLDAYRLSYYRNLKPNQEIIKWFEKYGDKARHIAITSTPITTASISAEWLFRHFGSWIRTFHVVPSKRDNINVFYYDKNKAEFINWISKECIVIDDDKENLEPLKAEGTKFIIWPQPWNGSKLTPNQALDMLTEQIFLES